MSVTLNRYANGSMHACTMSFDDGRIYDRTLVEIFNRYGLKGTFHLNSGKFGRDGYISGDEVASLYQGHEVSLHTVTHPHLSMVSRPTLLKEVLQDKETLEGLAGYPIRGMSLPFGDYDPGVVEVLRACGIEYFRTVRSTGLFALPKNLPEWDPTIHIKKPEPELIERFMDNPFEQIRLLYVWGHSYEFNDNDTWDMIEGFCRDVSSREGIWFATNIEVKEYLDALRALVVSQDETMVFNPSGIDVCVSVDGEPHVVRARELVRL